MRTGQCRCWESCDLTWTETEILLSETELLASILEQLILKNCTPWSKMTVNVVVGRLPDHGAPRASRCWADCLAMKLKPQETVSCGMAGGIPLPKWTEEGFIFRSSKLIQNLRFLSLYIVGGKERGFGGRKGVLKVNFTSYHSSFNSSKKVFFLHFKVLSLSCS